MSKEEAQAIPTADGDDDGRWEQDVADEGTENSRAKASSTDPLVHTHTAHLSVVDTWTYLARLGMLCL